MNITLIGMAGVGKSTTGKRLAKKLGYDFIDIDDIIHKYILKNHPTIKTTLNKSIGKQLIALHGDNKWLEYEEKAISSIKDCKNTIIATGGSAIYLPKAMQLLKNISTIVFLNKDIEIIKKQILSLEIRSVIGIKDKTFDQLFSERIFLYKRYADITINISKQNTIGNVMGKIIENITKNL